MFLWEKSEVFKTNISGCGVASRNRLNISAVLPGNASRVRGAECWKSVGGFCGMHVRRGTLHVALQCGTSPEQKQDGHVAQARAFVHAALRKRLLEAADCGHVWLKEWPLCRVGHCSIKDRQPAATSCTKHDTPQYQDAFVGTAERTPFCCTSSGNRLPINLCAVKHSHDCNLKLSGSITQAIYPT